MEFKFANPLGTSKANSGVWIVTAGVGVVLAGVTWAAIRSGQAIPSSKAFSGVSRPSDVANVAGRPAIPPIGSGSRLMQSPSAAGAASPSSSESAATPERELPYQELPVEGSRESMDDANMARGEAIAPSAAPAAGSYPELSKNGAYRPPSGGGAAGGGGAGSAASASAGHAAMYGKPGGGAEGAKYAEAQGYGGGAGVFPAKSPSYYSRPDPKEAANRPGVTEMVVQNKSQTNEKGAYAHSKATSSSGVSTTESGSEMIAPLRYSASEGGGMGQTQQTTRAVSEMSRPPRVPESKPVNPYSATPPKDSAPTCKKAGSECSPGGGGMACCARTSCVQVASNGGNAYYQCR